MNARKPVEENCTGSIDCPVTDHVVIRRFSRRSRISHIPLTRGQRKTLREKRLEEIRRG